MSLPKTFMDELRARVLLSDVIGKRMKLIRAGREHKGCCPFHKEKTASFTVNDVKGFYHCFGCGVHGDSIGFLTSHDNMSFMDAVEYLAGLAGMQVPKSTPEDERKYRRQASLYDLMELAAKWYERQLHDVKNKKILKYLTERGLSLETTRSFRLGFAGSDEQGLKQILLKAGFKTDDMLETGILKKSTRNEGDMYPFFRERVMFPVQDFQGRVVAFGGRVLPEAYGGSADKSAPKYINSPESGLYHKGRMLYGLSRARKAIGDGEPVVVVEGYMDVIALAQAGFRAAVAPLGTALTETQIQELWKVMPEDRRAPILCFDGDAAGQRAAGRVLDRIFPILKPDHSVKFAFLPKEHDPDSLVRNEGAPAMNKVLKKAIDLFEMMWMEEEKDHWSHPQGKAGFELALKKRALQIADMTVQKFFIHEIKQRVEKEFLTNTSTKKHVADKPFFKGKPVPPGVNTPYRPHNVRATHVKSEKSKQMRVQIFLALMIHYPELYDEFGESLGMLKIADSEYDQLRQSLINLLGEQNSLDYQAVKQHLNESGHGRCLDAIDALLEIHADFAKPGQPVEKARQAWRDEWEMGFKNTRMA
ncbi:MAG: DNA primase [Pseudomonadota bacterium]